jgi:hypothetical protein
MSNRKPIYHPSSMFRAISVAGGLWVAQEKVSGEKGKNRNKTQAHLDPWSSLHSPCDLDSAMEIMNSAGNRTVMKKPELAS